MGIMMFVTLERPIRGLKDKLGGKGLAWSHVQLDQLATELSLSPLSDYVSQTPDEAAEMMQGVVELAREYGHELPNELAIPEEQWFEAVDGLRTVRGLLAHLKANPSAWEQLGDPDIPREGLAEIVLEDLSETGRILSAAERKNVRFHFTCAY